MPYYYKSPPPGRRLRQALSRMTFRQMLLWLAIMLAWGGLLTVTSQYEKGRVKSDAASPHLTQAPIHPGPVV